MLNDALDCVFRREKGRVIGGLVRLLGSLDAAEEAFQDAALAALGDWPTNGLPANPGAWLKKAARNRALDDARHRRVVAEKAPLLQEEAVIEPETLTSIHDDQLRLIFTCCHPALTLESRVALTLKVVVGLTTDEIARALLSPEKTVAQRIVRAKRTIDEQHLPYEVPDRRELPERLAAVLAVVHLVFNEGHTAHAGPLVRLDLQQEALRLARVLCDLLPGEPEPFGLFALIAFSLARAAARTDADGELVRLADQDRSRWDRRTLKEGLMALARARRLGGAGGYVLRAEIASCHATAPSWESTDWSRILACYDALLALDASPVIALNRAVARSMLAGPGAALAELEALARPLASYHHFYAVRAELRRQAGQPGQSDDLAQALALATNEGERRFLRRQLAASKPGSST